jgi:hypothetical protein
MNGAGLQSTAHKNVKTTLKVELPSLANGLYIIKVKGEKRSWTKKYLIQ